MATIPGPDPQSPVPDVGDPPGRSVDHRLVPAGDQVVIVAACPDPVTDNPCLHRVVQFVHPPVRPGQDQHVQAVGVVAGEIIQKLLEVVVVTDPAMFGVSISRGRVHHPQLQRCCLLPLRLHPPHLLQLGCGQLRMVHHHRVQATRPDRSQLAGIADSYHRRSGLLGPGQQLIPLAAVHHRRLIHHPPLPSVRNRRSGEEPADVPSLRLGSTERFAQLVGGFLRHGQRPRFDPMLGQHLGQGTHRPGLARPRRRGQRVEQPPAQSHVPHRFALLGVQAGVSPNPPVSDGSAGSSAAGTPGGQSGNRLPSTPSWFVTRRTQHRLVTSLSPVSDGNTPQPTARTLTNTTQTPRSRYTGRENPSTTQTA